MRRYRVIAALFVVSMTAVVPVPAHADQFDFILELDNMGVSYESITDMIDIGKAVCHDLRDGTEPPVVLGRLQAIGFASAETGIILLSAVNNMCLDAKPGVVAWARDSGYAGPL